MVPSSLHKSINSNAPANFGLSLMLSGILSPDIAGAAPPPVPLLDILILWLVVGFDIAAKLSAKLLFSSSGKFNTKSSTVPPNQVKKSCFLGKRVLLYNNANTPKYSPA